MALAALVLAAAIPLVDGGRPKACVVLSDQAPEYLRFAACELTNYVARTSGAVLPTGPEAVPGLVPVTFLLLDRGETESGVGNDGFRIDASERGILLSSRCRAGLGYAVHYILSRFCGVRWFSPDMGDDILPSSSLAIPAGTLVKTPMFYRGWLTCGSGQGVDGKMNEMCDLWNARIGLHVWDDKFGAEKVGGGGGHIFGNLIIGGDDVDEEAVNASVEYVKAHKDEEFVNPEKVSESQLRRYARWRVLAEKHPEYFGQDEHGRPCATGVDLRDVGLRKCGYSMPCLSHPATRRALVANFRSWKRKNFPESPVKWTLFCDDHFTWCSCAKCQGMLVKENGRVVPNSGAADYWWDFMHDFCGEVLKDPLVTFNVGLYHDYRLAPQKVKPLSHPRLNVSLCPHGRCYIHAIDDANCPVNSRFEEMFRPWLDAGIRVEVFEYPSQTPGKCNYGFWERPRVRDVKWYARHGCGCGAAVGPWQGYQGQDNYYRRNSQKARWQITYLAAWFMWDPDDDFDTVQTEMLTRYYRKAAVPMAAYHRLLEKAFLESGMCMAYSSGGMQFATPASEPGLLEKAQAYLNEAKSLAANDTVLEKRIARDLEYFEVEWTRANDSFKAMTPVTIGQDWSAPITDFKKGRTPGDTPLESGGTEPYVLPTALRMRHDATNLYIEVTCGKLNGWIMKAEPTGNKFDAMRGSHLQLQVLAPKMNGRYWHYGVNCNGDFFAAVTSGQSSQDYSVPSHATARVEDFPDRWVAHVTTPHADLGGVKAGDILRIDVARWGQAEADCPGQWKLALGTLSGWFFGYPQESRAFVIEAPFGTH